MVTPQLNGRTIHGELGGACPPFCFIVAATVCALFLSSCQCNLHEKVTVASSQNALTIIGQGFSNTNPCARLSLVGLPGSPAVPIGTVNSCSGGSFQINWTPSYVPGCNANNSQSVDVSASDYIQTSCLYFANTSILWGKDCAIVGTCGKIGQRACPGETSCYLTGGVDATGNCVSCGGPNQPPCTIASATGTNTGCNRGLLPALGSPGQPPVICTAYCGYAQGAQEPCSILGPPDCQGAPPALMQPESPCITQTNVAGNPSPIPVYTCYGDSVTGTSAVISGCLCQAAPGLSPCQGSTSALLGICQAVQSVDQNCTQ